MHFHQPVSIFHLLTRGFLRRREAVADHLEYIGIGRQGKNRHHHALYSRRENQFVFGVFQVMQEITVENRLALLVKAYRRVKRFLAAGRHQAPQKGDDGGGYRVIDHEIDVGEFEQSVETLGANNYGVCINSPVAAV